MSIPLIVFCCAIYAPIQLAFMWLEQSWDRLNHVLLPFLFFPIVFLLLFEILVRVQQQSRRSLKIKDDRLIFPFDRHFSSVKLTQVSAFRFEPVPDAPDLRIVCIDIKSPRNNNARSWRIVLPIAEINSGLLPEVRKRNHHHPFSITFADAPTPIQPRPKLPQQWFFALGLALLVYSLPLFLVALSADRSRPRKQTASDHRTEKFKLTAEAKDRLFLQLSRHFKSFDQLRTFLLLVSGTVTLSSIGLILYDFRRLKRAGSKMQNPVVALSQRPSSLPP